MSLVHLLQRLLRSFCSYPNEAAASPYGQQLSRGSPVCRLPNKSMAAMQLGNTLMGQPICLQKFFLGPAGVCYPESLLDGEASRERGPAENLRFLSRKIDKKSQELRRLVDKLEICRDAIVAIPTKPPQKP